jgi:hypothetical protein
LPSNESVKKSRARGPGLKAAIKLTCLQGPEGPYFLHFYVPTRDYGWKGDYLREKWGRMAENWLKMADLGVKWGEMALLLPRHLQWRLCNRERIDAPCGVLTL